MSFLGRLPRGWRVLVLSTGLIAVLAVVGFGMTLLLAAQIRARLPRQITIERLRVSPLTLVLTADGLRIADRKGSPLFTCRRLSVDLQILSLLSREIVFREISLVEPAARVVISRDGRLNLTDLLALAPPSPPSRPPSSPSRELRIRRLAVLGARMDFLDLSRSPSFATHMGPLWLLLEEFRTRRDSRNRFSFSGSTESGERFWWLGDFSIVPFRSTGEFSLQSIRLAKYAPYYGNRVSFQVREGTLSTRARYVFDASPSSRKLALEKGFLGLRNFEAADPVSGEAAVRVPALDAEGINLDLVTGSNRISAISTRGGVLLCRREADGVVNLQRMFSPRETAGSAASQERAGRLTIGRIVVADYRVLFEDVSTPRPVRLGLSDIRVALSNFVDTPENLSDFTLEAVWEGQGHVSARGPLSPLGRRGTLDVRAQGLALAPLAPYLERFFRIRLVSADLSGRGRMEFVAEPPDFRFRGDIQFGRVAAVGIPRGDELFGWSSLSGTSIDFAFPRRVFSVRALALASPRLLWAVDPDGASRMMAALEAPESAVASAGSGQALPQTATSPAKPFRVRVGEVRVTGGRAAFRDASIAPNIRTSLQDFHGAVRGLSSEETARASVDLSGKVEGAGPIAIRGQINPLARADFTDLKLECRSVDLPPFGPYSGKYLGYGLRKGKLALDLKYRIERRHIDASNLITMDQFFLGEKTNSPSATKLPVKLAVALLRDRKGQIVLDVPVSGDLNDPTFRFGRVILRVLVNLLTKVATSPFTLLSKAFGGSGGGEELQYQEFLPGSVELGEADRRKLDSLVQALTDRPDLTLEIGSGLDAATDRLALERRKLDSLAKERKWADSSRRGSSVSPADVAVAPEEYPKLLREAFRSAFPQEADQGEAVKGKKKRKAREDEPAVPVEEMERKLLEKDPVTAEDLRHLMMQRRQAVRDYLLQGGIGTERLFLTEEVPPSTASAGQGQSSPRVLLSLGTGPG